jgi:hypothetical protein
MASALNASELGIWVCIQFEGKGDAPSREAQVEVILHHDLEFRQPGEICQCWPYA